MTGSSIFDYTHYDDHKELAEQLGLNTSPSHRYGSPPSSSSATDDKADGDSPSPVSRAVTPTMSERTSVMNPNPSKGFERCFCLRMKSTLTKRGVHAKCSGFRVVQILARMKAQYSFSLTRKHPPQLLGLVAMAIALPPPTITELLIDNDMFVTRLSPDLKITYIEPRIGDMMDLTSEDLTGRNLYDYCHAEDLQKLRKAHVDLLNKGQVLTDYYRLMNKHGGYVWIQTCATIICNSKTSPEDQNIIAINYVLSGIEYGGCVMNMEQYKVVSPNCDPDVSDQSECEHTEKAGRKEHRVPASRDRLPDAYDPPHPPAKKRKQCSSAPVDSEISSKASPDDVMFPNSDLAESSMSGIYSTDDSKFDKTGRIDNKNSRRKMDKPRKRKKECEDGEIESVDDERSSALRPAPSLGVLGTINDDGTTEGNPLTNQGCPSAPCMRTASPRHPSLLSNNSPDITTKICSPLPEDLSVRPLTTQSPVTAQTPPARSLTPNGLTSAMVSAAPEQNWVDGAEVNPDISSDVVTGGGSSVRDLEEAMNKHLPSIQSSEVEAYRAGLGSEYAASVMDYQKHKATIQWIGSHNTHPSVTDTLPATNLLRTLYASRESVIRTNIYNPRPQYYGDMQNTLLTPPGASDVYKDTYNMPQLTQPKSPPSTYSLMNGGYSTSPISVAMATNMTSDTYTMTPPSSVSPQEKYGSAGYVAEQMHADMTVSQLRQYDAANMPIKPHAYPLPAHSNSHLYERSASQYPAGGYYGTTPSAGFSYSHVPSPNPAHYRDASKTANAW